MTLAASTPAGVQDLVATRNFPSEDWSRYNRISVWVYPDIEGAPAVSIDLDAAQ